MPEEKKTFCRLCEVNCGLVATVDDEGRLAALAPDKSHPVTEGFACHKGLLAKEVHHDPDRLMHPLRKTANGFERASWDDAITDIAARLDSVIAEHGASAIAIYMGNPSAFNALGSMSVGMTAAALGTDRLFNAGTQDCSNKFAVGEILYGSAEIHPMADLDHADFVLMIGTNPRVSKMSFLSTPDPVATLRSVRDRGAKTVFVNPLAIADLDDVGETLQIKPDTDAYLLAAMLCEIEADPSLGFSESALGGVANVERLRDFVRAYPAERVEAVVGLSSEVIKGLAQDFAKAKHAAIHVSTGVNMGRQGTLAYYLAQMLSLVTGNLDAEGGNILPARAVLPMVLPEEASAYQQTSFGEFRPPRGTQPGALLADMIFDDAAPIKAMLVVAGNPLLSIGGGDRLDAAFQSLDLLVSADFYRNATAERADWVLPSADWFEREDLNYFVQGVQRRPYLQWTDAVVEPQGERREDWWIVSKILNAMGKPSLLDIPGGDVMMALWDGRLAETGNSIEALRSAPGGVLVLPEAEHGRFLARVAGPDGFDCCPDGMKPALARAAALLEEHVDELTAEAAGQGDGPLKLITRRTNYMMNSGFQNVKELKTAKGSRNNPLYMNPQDALTRGLREGQWIIVRNDFGTLRAELALDEQLREGVVAMSHGFGNTETAGMPMAQQYPGVNVNILSPVGPGSFDPTSAMSQLTGISVEVEAA
ncbi:MAG: molybdopterin-dependent oxidoreductase [Myxococcota bacterium]